MEKEYKYMVCTRCNTFNQATYIIDAMNGFTMQETTFPVVTVIVDDASTDGEQEVIRQYLNDYFHEPYRTEETEYADILCAHHKTNSNCQFVVFFLKYNHYSIRKSKKNYLTEWLDNAKYHALCEGDDYWIYKDKLERQVAYLEAHPDCTLCYHASNLVFSDDYTGLRNVPKFVKVRESYEFVDTIMGYPFQTATVVYRKELLKDPLYTKAIKEIGYSKILFMVAAYRGKLHGFTEQMSVYRKNNGGISNVIDKGPLALKRISAYTRIAELFPKKEKQIMHRVYILYLIWESYILTPFTDRQFFSMLLAEARKSPATSFHLFLRYFKRKVLLMAKSK